MKYGFTVPNNFGVDDPAEVVALAVEAEQLRFGSVWVNHHVVNVGYVWDRLGDGWHPMMLSPESVAKRLPVIREAAEAAGRPGIPAEVSVRRTADEVTPDLAAGYAAVGVTELVVSWTTGDVAEISEGLAAFAAEHGIGG